METVLQIIIPSIVMPLIISVLALLLIKHYPISNWIVPLIWIPSYIWISGSPNIPPSEAKDWLWLLLGLSIVINYFLKNRQLLATIMQSLLLTLTLIIIALPVLRYQFDIQLLIEITVVLIVSYSSIYSLISNNTSMVFRSRSTAIALAISCAGSGLVIMLAGSLLVGQLVGALAVVLAVFIVIELMFKPQLIILNLQNQIPIIQLYFALLVIARIFVELQLGLSLLLLLAPLIGIVAKHRFAYALSAISVVSAVSWLLLTADASSYY